MPEKIEIPRKSEAKALSALQERTPENAIWDFYEDIKDRNVGISLNNFILYAETFEGKLGGGLNHDYSNKVGGLKRCRTSLLEMGLDLGNMTFGQLNGQLKQEKPNFFRVMLPFILKLIKFGEIMKIDELKF